MLKQNITYIDFNDEKCEETLYFNISKSDLAENLDIEDRLRDIVKIFSGEKRNLSPVEVRTMIDLVKMFARLSYGKVSSDGKRFVKTPEMWEEFTQTAAYDEFLMSLFTDANRMYAFMLGVLPSDIRSQADTKVRNEQPELFAQIDAINDTPSESAPEPTKVYEEDNRPAWVRENRAPTKKELMSMSEDELAELYRQKVTAS